MALRRLACVVPLLVLVSACGSNKFNPPPPVGGSDGGGDTDGMIAGGGDGGGPVAVVDMAGFNTAGSPMVVITSPMSGAEVHGDTLSVAATVTSPTNTLINAGTVQVTITPPGGAVLTAQLQPGVAANSYQGQLDISAVPSGMATFTVSAADIAGKQGSATASYVHDHGPVLTFVKPTAATAKGTMSVEIIVDDALHPITSLSQVQAYIEKAPSDITLTQVQGATPFRVAATVDLVNGYNPPLDGQHIIHASATNSAGTVGTADKTFTVDNSGPTIANVKPVEGSFVGGVVEIQADITDQSKVNDATAVAVIGGNASVPLARTTPTSDTFHGFFDTRSLDPSYVLPEISIRADDLLGNHAEYGEEVVVDNTRPWMTMNGALVMRMGKPDSSNTSVECSASFPPLGPGAAKEGDTVLQLVTLRARIEDHGNTAPGLAVERYSGLNPDSVTLFAIPDTGLALAVDTDGDGACDNVNPLLVPTTQVTGSGQALALHLKPLSSGGKGPDFRLDAAHTPVADGGSCTPGTDPDCPPPGCSYVGDASVTAAPADLCLLAEPGFNYVVPYADPNVSSPIFTIGPVNGTECVGYQLDSLNTLPEGPTCVIALATDVAGNTNVSYPLHICIDRGGGKCAGYTPSAAACTGVWDKAMQQVTPGSSCVEGTTFGPNEVRKIPAG